MLLSFNPVTSEIWPTQLFIAAGILHMNFTSRPVSISMPIAGMGYLALLFI